GRDVADEAIHRRIKMVEGDAPPEIARCADMFSAFERHDRSPCSPKVVPHSRRVSRPSSRYPSLPTRPAPCEGAVITIARVATKPPRPSFRRERAAIKDGCTLVAGVDEAGRGPLAGPVVAAAVILDPRRIPRGIDDSKVMSFEEREKLYLKIMASAEVAFVS